MRKTVLSSNKVQVAMLCKELTRDYLYYVRDITDKADTDSLKRLSVSYDRLREVYRHSLCVALGLRSMCAFQEYESICSNFAKLARNILGDIVDREDEYKQGILQVCIHCIMMVTKRGGN